MANTYTQLYTQIVFAVKGREKPYPRRETTGDRKIHVRRYQQQKI
jgi:hypothetical protein